MVDKAKKQKRGGIITEKDVSILLNKYSANTVLTLLKEVAQFDGPKIDWDSLVKNTKTGISNLREYRMLWRHLAYRHSLPENISENDSGAEMQDDDSDLEFEVEAFPDVSQETAVEGAACVKVLAGFGLPSESSHPSGTTVEAPLTINIPNCKATSENQQSSAARGVNITVPVTVLKQPLPASTPAEGTDASGSRKTNPPKKKRKTWTQEEDMTLGASVQRCGEGNWDKISKTDFKGLIDADQLSQRWSIIKKKQGNINLLGKSGGVHLSEAQRAARHAVNLALNPPSKNTIANNSDPVRAAAIAAGARIAPQSGAASLLKPAAQSKNAIHIRTGAACTIRPFMPRATAAAAVKSVTGPIATSMAGKPVQSGQDVPTKVPHPTLVKQSPASTQHISSEQRNGGSISQQLGGNAESIKIPASENADSAAQKMAADQHKVDTVYATEIRKREQEGVVTSPKPKVELKTQVVHVVNSSASNTDSHEKIPLDASGHNAENSGTAKDTILPVKENGEQLAVKEVENKSKGDIQADSLGAEHDQGKEKSDAVIKSEPGSETMKGDC